ncbi:GNAT family N-acetyltransferase [Luteimonas terricola]|uniref:Acyl-CoA synthetase n=1 Tax=Luteimonas terricola TaxID=645597 RepID=A0ABQ2EEX9_9GAMM|nr:GNAT family N-acetyltransferase [Luteimonas terricola]GGK09852.1 acyl-CoA synthetase [Luteimonas terricola]
MVARNRLPPWHEEIRLGNGRDVLIRPIRPEDAPVLHASFELLQPDAMRTHLLGGVHRMGTDLSRQLSQPDTRNEFTLVVSEQLPPGEAMILGMARAAVAAGSRDAAFTILTSRNVAGMGLGRHLMRRLAKWARGKGLDALHGDIPEDNGPLLDLALSMGFGQVEGADPGFTRIHLPLAATTPAAGMDARA